MAPFPFRALLALLLTFFILPAQDFEVDNRLTDSDIQAGDDFGRSVTFGNGNVLVGSARDNTTSGTSNGSVVVFNYQKEQWQQVQKFSPDVSLPLPSDNRFGRALAAGGNYAAVGARHRVYIYHNTPGFLGLDTYFENNDASFGSAVTIDGEWLAVGAPEDNGRLGAVYLYRNVNGEWQFFKMLQSRNSTTQWNFGSAVALQNNRLAVGVPNTANTSYAGRVLLYEFDGADWQYADSIWSGALGGTDGLFGSSIGMDGDHIVVGAPDQQFVIGQVYFFQKQGGVWQLKGQFNKSTDNYNFGISASLKGNYAAVGSERNGVVVFKYNAVDGKWSEYLDMGRDKGSTGVHIADGLFLVGNTYNNLLNIYETVAMPKNVTASNGRYGNRVNLKWGNRSSDLESFKITRDGVEIASASKKASSYSDYNAVPGKIHRYALHSWNSEWGYSAPVHAPGWFRPNGVLSGKVLTRKEAGVRDITLEVTTPDADMQRGILFNNNYAAVIASNVANFPDTALTLSYWRRVDGRFGTPFSFTAQDTPSINHFTAWSDGVTINNSTVNFAFQPDQGVWHHYAITWRSSDGRLNIYRDGELTSSHQLSAGEPIPSEGLIIMGQTRSYNPANAMEGAMDEVRLWRIIRPDSLIASERFKRLTGDEEGLVSYWTFDDADRGYEYMAPDIAFKGGNHGRLQATSHDRGVALSYSRQTDAGGRYSFKNVFYDRSRVFELTPFKEGHGFDPGSLVTEIDIDGPKSSGLDITDTTSLTVSGTILLAGTSCAVPGVEIMLNSKKTGVYTDNSGRYRLTIEEPGYYTIKPVLADSNRAHIFEPELFSGNIHDNIADMDFSDLTTSLLEGKVSAACNTFIGRGEIHISSAGNQTGCVDTTLVTDENGNYSITLPAQPYLVELLSIDPQPGFAPDEYFSPVNSDLTFQDTVLNFVYRTPPIIRITGLPEICPDAADPFRVPVVSQYEELNLVIEVLETYQGDTCAVDTGFVEIYDDIGGNPEEAVRLPIENGKAYYTLEVGAPNILDGGEHPFQKLLQIVANAEGQISSLNQWILVTGNRPREKTFVTRTPELPFLILHDPPGDNSYAYWQKDSSYSTVHSMATEVNGSAGVFVNAKYGAGIKVPFIGTIGAYVHTEGQFLAGRDNKTSDAVVTTWSFSENVSTSTAPDYTGESGDVVMGGSFNLIYSLTDIIDWDEENCRVVQDTSLAWGAGEFATTYFYTIDHIQNTLIPDLKTLRSLASPDSARLLTTYIDVWEQVVEDNRRTIANAETQKNISFSGGTSREYSATTSKDSTHSYEFTAFIESEVKIGLGFRFDQINESEYGVAAKFRWASNNVQSKQIVTSTTVGYVLSDDDPGDSFTVDVGSDPVYGTPVFRLVSGTSSCPFEPGTQPRDEPLISLNTLRQDNIPPDKPAAFILNLGNASQSGDTREYRLSVLQSSNYDGAIIRVGGVVVEDGLNYTIPAGQQITATMTVERGPIAYSYNNLKLVLSSPCDGSRSDTVAFSVNFRNDCPTVDMYRPVNNWLVNQSDNDTLLVVLRNYEKDNPDLKKISLQYRKIGEAWQTAQSWEKGDLPDDFVYLKWFVGFLADGAYELRAVSNCGPAGVTYSAVASGIIDRSTLYVFGQPQPADRVLNIGDEIALSFTADLDCSELRDSNIRLTDETTGQPVPHSYACNGNTIIITPSVTAAELEGHLLTASVSGARDLSGNRQKEEARWSFTVNQNAVYWKNPQVTRTLYEGESSSFTSVISNASGTAQTFELGALPFWIQAEPLSGTIQSGAETEVRFTLSPSLNMGTYSDTLTLGVAGQADDPLYVAAEVISRPPDWEISPAAWQYSMNIIARVLTEKGFSENDKDIVAVFSDGTLRGRANLQYVGEEQGYFAFITAYSNSPSGETLTFKVWNAGDGLLSGFTEETVEFTDNGSVGRLQSPLTLRPQGRTQTIDMESGWNWISFNVEQRDMSVNSVLAGLQASEGDVIKSQTAMAVYSEDLGWVGSLREIHNGLSYRLRLKKEQPLDFSGTGVPVDGTTLTLRQGWNWIGYLPRDTQPLATALGGYQAAEGDRIRSRNAFAVYDAANQAWQGDLTEMTPGAGYLLKTARNGTLLYGTGTTADRPSTVISRGAAGPATADNALNPYAFEANMNLVAVLQLGGTLSRDTVYTVRAYIDDEPRGIGALQRVNGRDESMLFLTIHNRADGNDSIRFEISDGRQTYTVNERLLFVPDDVTGNLTVPFVLTVKDESSPLLTSVFHYSSAPGLKRFVKLYISANEPLASAPFVLVTTPGGGESTLAATLFDADNHIYQASHTLNEEGSNVFYIVATDFGNNSTREIKTLNMQSLSKGRAVRAVLDSSASYTVRAGQIRQDALLFTETEPAAGLEGELRAVSAAYRFFSPDGFNEEIELTIHLPEGRYDEEERRKIALYRFDERNGEWTYVGGRVSGGILSARVAARGLYGALYDPDRIVLPEVFALHQNYPNPFNPVTRLRFDLPEKSRVRLEIYNMLGQKVATVVDREMEAGFHTLSWNGRDASGAALASGVYIYRLRAGDFVKARKMILLK